MLLTISTTHRPATDLGYLLHKNPDRLHEFKLPFGTARVFYPEASESRCTAALLLDVDPVALVRGRGRSGGGLLTQYVNDRPYAVSSFLSVAISRVFGTALGARSKHRESLVGETLPLSASLAPLPCRGGLELLEELPYVIEFAVVEQEDRGARSHRVYLAVDPLYVGDSAVRLKHPVSHEGKSLL